MFGIRNSSLHDAVRALYAGLFTEAPAAAASLAQSGRTA